MGESKNGDVWGKFRLSFLGNSVLELYMLF
jgi:hypothetical protein